MCDIFRESFLTGRDRISRLGDGLVTALSQFCPTRQLALVHIVCDTTHCTTLSCDKVITTVLSRVSRKTRPRRKKACYK